MKYNKQQYCKEQFYVSVCLLFYVNVKTICVIQCTLHLELSIVDVSMWITILAPMSVPAIFVTTYPFLKCHIFSPASAIGSIMLLSSHVRYDLENRFLKICLAWDVKLTWPPKEEICLIAQIAWKVTCRYFTLIFRLKNRN